MQTTTALGSISNPSFLSLLTFSLPPRRRLLARTAAAARTPCARMRPRAVPRCRALSRTAARRPAPRCLAAVHRCRALLLAPCRVLLLACCSAAALPRAAACVLRRCRTLPRAGAGEEGAQVVGEEAPVQLSILVFSTFHYSNFNIPYLQFQ